MFFPLGFESNRDQIVRPVYFKPIKMHDMFLVPLENLEGK